MSHLRLLLLSLAAVAVVTLSGLAQAADRKVTIINKTSYIIVEFYASRASTSDWEEDILGADILAPNQRIRIDIDDGTGACRFDFKAVFDDGDEVVKENVDVCRISEFSFTE